MVQVGGPKVTAQLAVGAERGAPGLEGDGLACAQKSRPVTTHLCPHVGLWGVRTSTLQGVGGLGQQGEGLWCGHELLFLGS